MAEPKLPKMRDIQVKTVGSVVHKDMLGRSKRVPSTVMKRTSGRRSGRRSR